MPLLFRVRLSYTFSGQIPVRHKEAAVKILKLPKEKLDLFASVVQQFGELHAPVEQDGKYAFKRLTRWSDARLEYDRTILPPKKYYLPPRETLFRYRPGEGFVPHTDGLDQRIILFGVHACDVYAINILDRVFAGKYQDPYYQARRGAMRAWNTTAPFSRPRNTTSRRAKPCFDTVPARALCRTPRGWISASSSSACTPK